MFADRTIETQTKYYRSYSDDFVESKNQNVKIPKGYQWIHKNPMYRIAAKVMYLAMMLFAFFYSSFVLHIKVQNKSVLKQCAKTGYFLYGNHTQPVGDAFVPARIVCPKHMYAIASPANLGIPVLGRILPMLGALPVPDSLAEMKQFYAAIRQRIGEHKCVVVYPETHVWPWCTEIRPFSSVSFGFPVDCNAPCFAMTTTYQKRKHGKKPGITIYLDGPFYPDPSLSKKKQKKKLCSEIYDCMVRRSANSTCQYIYYEKEQA